MHLLAKLEISLQPRWDFSGALWVALALFALGGLIALYLLRLLRGPERVMLSASQNRFFLLLRASILFLVLFLLLFSPELRDRDEVKVPSHILLAVDNSGSMSFADFQRTDREVLELAVAAGLKTSNAKPEQFRNWLQKVQGGSEPSTDEYRVGLAELRSMTRAALARSLINEGSPRFLSLLKQDHEVRFVTFNENLVSGLASSPPAGDTNLALPLRYSAEAAAGENRCVGVILLTDGRQTRPDDPLAEAASLKKLGLPVFPIVFGSPTPIPDLAVLSAKATPAIAFRKSTIQIRAKLKVVHLPKGTIRLRLSGNFAGKPLAREQSFEHDGKSTEYTRQFDVPADDAGEFIGEVIVEWLGEGIDAITANNRCPVRYRVVDDTAKVLLIDSEMRYETHYLHTALDRDPSVRLQMVILNPPRINALSEEGLKEQGIVSTKLPNEFGEWMNFDCIIIGDVDFHKFTEQQRSWLERYVTERGGTLVFVAGKKYMPFGASDGAPMDETLARLLPITTLRQLREEDGFVPLLSAEGKREIYLQLHEDSKRSAYVWRSLPRSYWGVVGRCKPSAFPLTYVLPMIDPEKTPGPIKIGELERENALFVRQNVGFGKVFYLGMDSTWRWRYRMGDEIQFRFWGQLIRWAASDHPLSAGNDWLRFGAREPVITSEQSAELVVRFTEQAMKQSRFEEVRMQLHPENDPLKKRIVSMKESPGNPNEWKATAGDLKPGKYIVEPLIPALRNHLTQSNGEPLRSSFEVIAPVSKEDLDVTADFELMNDLAVRTGGKAVWAKDADQIPALLKDLSATREVMRTWNLSDSWWLFGIVLTLLTVEWTCRKLWGLA